MELDNGYWQAIQHALPVLGQVQVREQDLSDQVESLHQVAPTPVEPALRGDVGKQVSMLLPVAEHFRLLIPPSALTDQGHRDQLAITTDRCRARPFEQRSDLLPDVVHDNVHPQAEIIEIGYHVPVLLCEWVVFANQPHTTREDILSTSQKN